MPYEMNQSPLPCEEKEALRGPGKFHVGFPSQDVTPPCAAKVSHIRWRLQDEVNKVAECA